MFDSKITPWLRCPLTRTLLRVADQALISSVNQAIDQGRARDRDGQPVPLPIEAGLLADGWLYPIRNGIPILVAEAAIGVGAWTGESETA